MAMFTYTEAANVLDAVFGVATYTDPGTPQLALTTTNGTASAPGTQVSGGSYAMQPLTMGAADTGAGTNANSAAVVFTNMPDTSGVGGVKGIEIYDSVGTRRMLFGALTATKTTALGDTLSFDIGTITGALV